MKLKKLISSSLVVGLIFNTTLTSLADVLSQDGRYETFEGNNITIDNILEEDKIDVEIEGETLINLIKTQNEHSIKLEYPFTRGETYTFVYEFDSNMDCYAIVEEFTSWSYIVPSQKVKQGRNRINVAVTIPNTYVGDYSIVLTNRLNGAYDSSVKFTNVEALIVKGNHVNKNLNTFKGMKSVGQDNENGHHITIESNSKNLFDINTSSEKKMIFTDGGEHSNDWWLVHDFLPIEGNTTITISEKHENNEYFQYNIAFYDKNKKFIKVENIQNHLGFATLKTPDLTKYYRLGYSTIVSGSPVNRENIMVEIGSKKSGYSPYNHNKIKIPLSEPLRGLPNGIADKVVKISGKWVIERNLGEVVIDGNKGSFGILTANDGSKVLSIKGLISRKIDSISMSDKLNHTYLYMATNYSNLISDICTWLGGNEEIRIYIKGLNSLSDYMDWIKTNQPTLIYQLEDPTYESLNIDSTLNIYLDTTHMSNNSNIPANMKVTVDRTINKATEAIQIAKENPTIENISQARYWANLMKETIKKDEVNNQINDITTPVDLNIEKKTASANIDVYVKSDNSLSMTLSTNLITFDKYTGADDIEKNNVLEITIHSSLPYDLNAYLEENIQNSDKSVVMDSNLLQIKESTDIDYKSFINTKDKIVLAENNSYGNYKKHNIDLKIEGSNAYKADIYKTTVKFEAEQK